MTAVVIIEGLVILLLLILVAGLLRSHAEILRQLHRLGVPDDGVDTSQSTRLRTTGFETAPAAKIVGIDPSGASRSVSLDHGRGETLLAFLSTGCTSCRTFWEALDAPVDMPTPDTRPVIVTKGTSAESPKKVAELAPTQVPVIMSDDAWDTFKVPLTPYFMLVDGDGRVIGEGSASNWQHLIDLLSQSLDDSSKPMHLDTDERERFTDERLFRSGVNPGDPTLYENPIEE
ncbi:MAG: hypothetical protein V3S26_08940 [Acidimicrobiia bacterium]